MTFDRAFETFFAGVFVMRKTILFMAMAFLFGSAHAQSTATPTVASEVPKASEPNGPAQTAEQPAPEQPTPQAPAAIERPKLIPAEQAKIPTPTARPVAAERLRRKHESTEDHVIYELHRHGIYW
jgi:hypothetical protein